MWLAAKLRGLGRPIGLIRARGCVGKTMNYGADLRVARSFEFDAVKTLGLWLGTLSRLLGWLASRKLLALLEAPSFLEVLLLRLGVLYAGLLVDVDLLAVLGGLLRLLEASFLVDVDFFPELSRRLLLGLAVVRLLVDVNFLTVLLLLLGTTEALFFVDADLFLDVALVLAWGWTWRVNGGCEGFVRLFVALPSV